MARVGGTATLRPAVGGSLVRVAGGTCGRRAIAVVLSGSGADGAAGVRAVKSAGGTVIVEDRTTAQFFGMPNAAIRTGAADMVLPIHEISGALVAITLETLHERN
jgi:two-component system chemotaxis response regulator CheB